MKVFVKSISQRDDDALEVKVIIFPYRHQRKEDPRIFSENDEQWLDRNNLHLGEAELTQKEDD